ncbi:Cobyrinic acid ac-diamide synthase [Desulfovibrio sp. X2]|uniref:MinD/ParA family protein n=1 Tax=Desulfovibrio sp. X2 TaxID=941449 RepID=UPI000358BF7A|nr:MinD/ParA family protein [Desulfovibrio sp. X2]EPR37410.1 Cobyrinic acid ac-diamide synthase [Desulfovibrio sp. X2]
MTKDRLPTAAAQHARVIAIASGKGGVGKTSVAVNTAVALAESGQRVCLLDADLGLANVDILLGLSPDKTLEDVLFDGLPLERALVPVCRGLDVLPGSSGVQRMANLSAQARTRLVREVEKLADYDFLIVDNSPGISPQIVSLCLAAQEVVVVTTPEATSVTDAYALIKVMKGRGLARRPLLLVNRARGEAQARLVFEKVDQTARRYLGQDCAFLGTILDDPSMARAAALRRPVSDVSAASPATTGFRHLAATLSAAKGPYARPARGASAFFRDFLVKASEASLAQEQAQPSKTQGALAALRQSRPLERLEAIAGLVENLPGARDRDEALATWQRLRDEVADLRTSLTPALAGVLSENEGRAQQGPRGRAAILCDDPSMREVLAEIVIELGLMPIDALTPPPIRSPLPGPALLLACWDGPRETLEKFVRDHGEAPLVLMEGYPGSRAQKSAAVQRAAAVVRRPFRIDELKRVIARFSSAARNAAT